MFLVERESRNLIGREKRVRVVRVVRERVREISIYTLVTYLDILFRFRYLGYIIIILN